MTTQLKPSSWLLNDEPDLTPDQVWLVRGGISQDETLFIRDFRDGVAIADTAEQAIQAVKEHGWTPFSVANETMLSAQIEDAENAPAYVVHNLFGQAGTLRFGCVFATYPLRLKWVLAASERAARNAWRKLGEAEAPRIIHKLSDLTARRDKVRNVRLQRGNGAMTDGREFSDRDERWYELEAQKRPGGRAELNAEARRLVAIRERIRAMRQAANDHKDSTP